MTGRASSLKSIRIGCSNFWDVSLARLASKCPLLEEIECSYQRLPANLFRYVGTMCPHLKRLRIHRQWSDSHPLRRAIEMENQGCENEGNWIPGNLMHHGRQGKMKTPSPLQKARNHARAAPFFRWEATA